MVLEDGDGDGDGDGRSMGISRAYFHITRRVLWKKMQSCQHGIDTGRT